MTETTKSTELPPFPWTGRCACDLVHYSIDASPLIIHSCHCHSCQIESGSVCAVNYIVEKSHFKLSTDKPLLSVPTPSDSKKNQLILRCPRCYVALYSHYAAAGEATVFVRLGTLDAEFAKHLSPELFIYQDSKMPWFVVPEGKKTFATFYLPADVWCAESKRRMDCIRPAIVEWQKAQGCWDLEWEKADNKAEEKGD